MQTKSINGSPVSEQDMCPAPRRVDIYLTRNCNLSCPFCFYRSNKRSFLQQANQEDMPVEKWLFFLNELEGMQVFEVGLMGGEALIYDGFWDIVEHLSSHRMRFALFSNGVLLDENTVSRIALSRRCSYVQISIDGTERSHDAIRGKGVHSQAIAAIGNLRKAGIPVRVNMVLTRNSAKDIANEVCYLIENAGVGRIRINPVAGADERMTEDEMALALKELLPLRERYKSVLSKGGIFKYFGRLGKPFEQTDERKCPDCSAQLSTRCAVLADGSVIPCMEAENIIIGNVFHEHFAEMWNSEAWRNLRMRVKEPRTLPSNCDGCRFVGNCMQNCLSESVLCTDRICYRLLAERLAIHSVGI